MKNFIFENLKKIDGKVWVQDFFKKIHTLSLKGMNYGNGGKISTSGELNVLSYIKKSLNSIDSLVILDVGANVGDYSKALAEFFQSGAMIYSFEPSRESYDRFLKNTFGITNVNPNNFGLSHEEGVVSLYSDTSASELASVYQRNLDHFSISMNMKEEVKLSTIDIFCREQGIERIHFLKLDIEGHELNALKGADRMIQEGMIDFIQFEFGGGNIDSRTYFQDFYYLLNDKYHLYRILRNGLAEIIKYRETDEVFITVNYLAQLRK